MLRAQLEGGSPLYGLYRFLQPQRDSFSAVLVINRVSILAILVINRVWFLHSSLDMGKFLRSFFVIIIDKTINKSPKLCLWKFNNGLN